MTELTAEAAQPGATLIGMPLASVCAYRLPDDVRIEEAPRLSGPSLWAVRRHGACMNQDGDWEYEPMPRSRDDAFLARCRWSSPEAAYAVWDAKAR